MRTGPRGNTGVYRATGRLHRQTRPSASLLLQVAVLTSAPFSPWALSNGAVGAKLRVAKVGSALSSPIEATFFSAISSVRLGGPPGARFASICLVTLGASIRALGGAGTASPSGTAGSAAGGGSSTMTGPLGLSGVVDFCHISSTAIATTPCRSNASAKLIAQRRRCACLPIAADGDRSAGGISVSETFNLRHVTQPGPAGSHRATCASRAPAPGTSCAAPARPPAT